MAIVTNNQKPTELNSLYTGSVVNVFDPYTVVKDEIVKPLFQPLIPGQQVNIIEDGKALSEDDITDLLFDCSGDAVVPQSEDRMKEIFQQTLTYYAKDLSVQSVYAVQAGLKEHLPLPTSRCKYLPTDVIDASKQLMSGQLSRDAFFATVAFYTRVDTFGYYFVNDAAWSDFQKWMDNEIQQLTSVIPADTVKLCQDLQNIRLNQLTQSFVLRDDDSQNNDPYSFARIFPFYLMMYDKLNRQNGKPAYLAGHMPFSFAENLCPRTVVIMNVEKHAHAHPADIQNEWNVVQKALQMRPKVLGNNKIQSLTSVARMATKIAACGAMRKSSMLAKSAQIRFRKTPPTITDLYGYIVKIYKHASFVQTSENATKCYKMTYQRPSRRDPDNPDRMGKTTGWKFKPDLHVYLDCSGSISERQYQDAIKACIKLAKKMNVNFYFNSFSHIMSQTTKLKLKDRSVAEIYKEFRKIPKVGGGTDYEQIWHYINRSQKFSKEVSIVISDFEYTAPNHYVKHPRFLYYAPISTSDWSLIRQEAAMFAKSMLSICPSIRQHILM